MAAAGSALRSVCVSAPGKLILTGEHSVVFGKPAVAASLNLRTAALFEAGKSSEVSLELPDLNIASSWPTAAIQAVLDGPPGGDGATEAEKSAYFDAIRRLAKVDPNEVQAKSLAAVAFLHLYTQIACGSTGKVPSGSVRVHSQLPVGAGLGSSAAFSVALSAGLLQAAGLTTPTENGGYTAEDQKLVNKWAFEGEKVIHGTPSGIDNSVSTFGGAIHFVKGDEPVQLEAMPTLRILLVNTKVPRSTMALVAGVRELKALFPAVMDPVIDAMGELSLAVEGVLGKLAAEERNGGQWAAATATQLETLVDLNQHLLKTIGVGHKALDEVCAVATEHGGHAKLTGAGGGGCAFVVLPQAMEKAALAKLSADYEARGFEVWETTVGGPGVQSNDKLPFEPAATATGIIRKESFMPP